jgi:hypothetical protein
MRNSFLTSVATVLTCLLTQACTHSESDQGTDTGEPVQTLGLHDAVRSDLLASNLGLLWSTDLSPDMVILREAGTAFTFLSAEFAIWGQRVASGQSASLDNCMTQADMGSSNGVSTTKITLNGCFVGANRDRRLNGKFTAEIEKKKLQLAGEWNFKLGAVDLSGTFQSHWKNVNSSSDPEALFSLDAVYDGNTYNHRTFSIKTGEVIVSDRYEHPPKYLIPDSKGDGVGASLSWDNREDRLDFGLMLENSDGRYQGDFWGEYTGASGQVLSLSNGSLEETQGKDLILRFSGSAQNQSFEITELVQTWGNQNAAFDAELGFSYTASTQVTLGAYSTPLDLLAYTVTPLQIAGANQTTTLTGAIESALNFQNEKKEGQEHWTFGICEALTQGRDQEFGDSGSCTFNNATGAHIGLYFSEETPATGWLLIEKAPNEWICRNLENGEEQDLGTHDKAPGDCPD